jgi:arylsulfatase A-like enzyme/cytochrome c-type biogenesis protein CcmH/NrfG
MLLKSLLKNNDLRSILCLTILLLGVIVIPFLSPASREKDSGRLNVLLITIDTLRADRLSCYSGQHLKTPNIDSLSERGTLFLRAFAHTTTTLPSHSNMLLGVTPPFHGVHGTSTFVVSKEFLTLAEHLKNHGYATGAFVGGYPLDSRFGLNQGFDIYDDDFKGQDFKRPPVTGRRAEVVVDKALNWLENQASPWFLWIHCFDPHDPYMPPEPFSVQYEKQPYEGEVAYVDFALGKLIDYLKANRLFENTLVIFTGDHGESLGQHGELTHGYLAYNTTLWIPLIISFPGVNPGKTEQYVGHIDLFPTVCDVLHISKPSFLQGISLLPAMEGRALQKRPIYFESMDPYFSKGWAPLRGFLLGPEKYMDSPIPEVYDLAEDFDEIKNLARSKDLSGYNKRLDQLTTILTSPESEKAKDRIDRESLEKLRSLGYLSTSSSQDQKKESFGPGDDVKVLLAFLNKAMDAMEIYQKGRVDEGIRRLHEIIKERKDFAIAYYDLGIVYKETGKLNDALRILKSGLDLLPSNFEIFFNYTSYLLAADQTDEVIKLISENKMRAMDYDPGIWINLGFAYSAKGDLEKAIGAFEKSLSLDNKNPTVHNNLGTAYHQLTLKTKDPITHKKCLESFKKAIELDPDYASPYAGLGAAYRFANNLDGAIYCWGKALQLNPEDGQILYSLGLAYSDKGEKTKALGCLTRYKEHFSPSSSPEERRKLDELIRKLKQNR